MRRYPSDRNAHSRRMQAWLAASQACAARSCASCGPAVPPDQRDRGPGRDRLAVERLDGRPQRRPHARRGPRAASWSPAARASSGSGTWPSAACRPGPRPAARPSARSRLAAQRSLRALGVATTRDIDRHFTAGRYPGLAATLAGLERAGRIEQVHLSSNGAEHPGPWYVHADDLPLLERLRSGDWQPRTALLSPSTTSSSTASGPSACSASTSAWRSTSPKPPAATATSSPSSTATASSAGSIPPSTAPATAWSSRPSTPSRRPGVVADRRRRREDLATFLGPTASTSPATPEGLAGRFA